jgi:hypothetical protein
MPESNITISESASQKLFFLIIVCLIDSLLRCIGYCVFRVATDARSS